jgi:dihydropyrimidine dehydrogenase (NAD+) subunit PreT
MLGRALTLADLRPYFDFVLGLGPWTVNALGSNDDDMGGVEDAVAIIETLRLSSHLSASPISRRIVMIGGMRPISRGPPQVPKSY